MSTNLHAASSQWANRPADERFWTLRDMRMACEVARANSIGARLRVLSRTALGTEVELRVPGRIAFEQSGHTWA